MGFTQKIGNEAEEAAAEYLSAAGFELLHRNWRSGRYELDIVARRDGVLHFVEVKCRQAGSLTTPEEAITTHKAAALGKAAAAYIEQHGLDCEVQFDLVKVVHQGGVYQTEYIPEAIVQRW